MQDPESPSQPRPPIPSPTDQVPETLLECPYCHFRFVLTWPLYREVPLWVLQCPQCREKSDLKQPRWAYVVTFSAMFTVMVLCMMVLVRAMIGAGLENAGLKLSLMITAFLMSLPVTLLLDKTFSMHFGRLVKRKDNRQ